MKNLKRYYLNNFDPIDIKISNVLVLHLFILISKNMIVNTNSFIYSFNDTLNLLITGVFVLLYMKLYFNSKVIKRIRTSVYLLLVVAFLFIGISLLVYPDRFLSDYHQYRYVKIQFRTFIAYSLPLFVAVGSLRSLDCLLYKLYDNTLIPYIFATVAFISSLNDYIPGGYMPFGNATMFLAIILLFKFNHTRDFLTLFQFISTCFYLFISGSRGPLLSLFVAVVIFFILNGDMKKVLAVLLVGLVIAVFFYMYYQEILEFCYYLLKSLGFDSRTLRIMVAGELLDDSGRQNYHNGIILALRKSPFIGLGAFAGEATVGLAHSLYFDIFANFGYLLGSFLLIFIFGRILYLVVNKKFTAYSEMLLILSAVAFPIGLVDTTFWASKELWIIFAMFLFNKKYISNKVFHYKPIKGRVI